MSGRTRCDALVFADLDAGTGGYDVTVTNHPFDSFQQRTFTSAKLINLMPANVALFDGTPTNAT